MIPSVAVVETTVENESKIRPIGGIYSMSTLLLGMHPPHKLCDDYSQLCNYCLDKLEYCDNNWIVGTKMCDSKKGESWRISYPATSPGRISCARAVGLSRSPKIVSEGARPAELRRHALKLRFWPGCRTEDTDGQVLDLDWCWIRSLPRMRIGELRIHDTIGDCDNLRVIFYVPPNEAKPPMLWVLSVLQPKTQ